MKKSELPLNMYCVECRARRRGIERKLLKLKTGKPVWQSNCEICGTEMFRVAMYNTAEIN